MSSAAAAHLEMANGDNLPAHIARAQAARPKLTVLNGEPMILDAPATLLQRALRELETATFRGGDAEVVKAQFLHLEWIMRTAMLQSTSATLHGTALTEANRKSVFNRMRPLVSMASRRSGARGGSAVGEAEQAAHPQAEPVHQDNQLGQAVDESPAQARSPRDTFLQDDASEAREQQSIRRDHPGSLIVARPHGFPELEDEFAV